MLQTYKHYTRKANIDDVRELGLKLRAADLQEVYASSGRSGSEALFGSFHNSKTCFSIIVDFEVVGMFGIGRTSDSRRGLAWLLGSDRLSEHPKKLMYMSTAWLEEVMQEHDVLYNYVDARNLTSARWLSWLNFDRVEKIQHGYEKRDFWLFARFASIELRQNYLARLKNNILDGVVKIAY